jgi:hypothetical protein
MNQAFSVSSASPFAFGFALFLTGVCGVLFSACSTVDSRIEENPQVYASLSTNTQSLVRQGMIREGMPKSAIYLAWGRADRVRFGSRAGHPFEAWVYTTTQSQIVTSYYPTFYRFGYYRYGGYWPYHHFWGGRYPFDPFVDDVVTYEVPYKVAFFEGDRCTGWEYIR